MIFLFLFSVNFFVVADGLTNYSIFPSEVYVRNGEGLILQFLPRGTPLLSCTVKFGGNSWSLTSDLSSDSGMEYWGESLETGDCGVRIVKYNKTFEEKWLFQSNTSDGTLRVASTTIHTCEDDESWNGDVVQVELGKEATLHCESDNVFSCYLSNPEGEIVSRGSNCSYHIPTTTVADLGMWNCTFDVPNIFEPVIKPINVTAIKAKKIDIGMREQEKATILYCKNLGNEKLQKCRFETPDGRTFILSDGHNVDRYSYYGDGVSESDCGIRISKPLQTEDYGTWTCSLTLENSTQIGGFITVPGKPITQSENSKFDPSLKETEVTAKLSLSEPIFVLKGNAIMLSCSIKVSIDYCWFQHPNGSRFQVHPLLNSTSWQYDGDGLKFGVCGIKFYNSSTADSGDWICGMGISDNVVQVAQDIEKTFRVVVTDTVFMARNVVVTASIGQKPILSCQSTRREAIEYCSFIAPNGTRYNLSPYYQHDSIESHYKYYGNGLEYGECGISINGVTSDDYGKWQCLCLLVASKDGMELSQKIQLVYPNLMSSSAIGALVGVIAGLLAATSYYSYRKAYKARGRRRQRQSEARPAAVSFHSNTSDEVVEFEMEPTRPVERS